MNTKESFKQRQLKPGRETGSFVNMMMSGNSSLPEVGKGATVLSWTDRHAYEVIEVSEDKKMVVVQEYNAKRIDDNGMSECQDYEYKELNETKEVIVWKWGAWRWERNVLQIIDENAFYERPISERCDENGLWKHIEGLTKWSKEYRKVNILWGVKRQYYDYTF